MRAYRVLLVIVITLFNLSLFATSPKYDDVNDEINSFFSSKNTTYILRYHHSFNSSVSIPEGCSIIFQGGSLCGPITFMGTKLLGDVKLHGSLISGSISNTVFESEWLCFGDGSHDDAHNINMMIEVCGNIHFSKGIYRLISKFEPPKDMIDKYRNMISSHIGIHSSNVSLKGEPGAIFQTNQPLGMICVYTIPHDIENSVSHIRIDGLTFHTENDGKQFHQVQHTIKCIGVNDFRITNCFFDDFWGDAICLCHFGDHPGTGEMIRNSHVIIRDNIIIGGSHYNTRNGIAVINGFDVFIDNNYIKRCAKKDMPGAIDIEANNSAFTIRYITVSNNTIEDCGGTAGGICVHANDRGGEARNINILYNSIKNCSYGLAFVVNTDNTTESYVVQGNVVDKDTNPVIFVGNSKSNNWIIRDNIFGKRPSTSIPGKIQVSNLICKDNIFGN